jgi:DNA (cytosine-5)-methyltransferase 1
MGYHRAGFDVIGVDKDTQPNYPFEFVQMDVFEYMLMVGRAGLRTLDLIHASPPCQAYSSLGSKDGRHPKLIAPTRELLRAVGVPFVIENIETARAELINPIRLCGSAFGLHVRRHDVEVTPAVCRHAEQGEIRAYYGKKGWLAWSPKGAQVQKVGRKPLLRGSVEQAPADMGIDWMTWDELREAIPPAYTEHIGKAFLASEVAA